PLPLLSIVHLFFFFHATAPTAISTLSLHDALPICQRPRRELVGHLHRFGHHPHRHLHGVLHVQVAQGEDQGSHDHRRHPDVSRRDRKSTRLNSSHVSISYAVFCLKKKKT